MAYTKTTWVAEETALSPANFNHMEEGIAVNDAAISIDATVIAAFETAGWEDPTA